MTVEELTAHMLAFVESKGWLNPDSKHPQTPKNLAVSLVLEANEVLEHFQWTDEAKDKAALAGELADVLLYLMQIAHVHDIDLTDSVMSKLDENHRREW